MKRFHHYEIWAACDVTAFWCNTASARSISDARAVQAYLNARAPEGIYYRLSLNFQES